MDTIDLALDRTSAEGLIIGTVQRALRIAVGADTFAVRTPITLPPSIVIGERVFGEILRGVDPTAPSDGLFVPFYITSINVTEASIEQRTPSLIGVDSPTTTLDDVDSPAVGRLGVLVQPLAVGFGGMGARNFQFLQLSAAEASRVSEVAVRVTFEVTVQNQEGWPSRPVRRSTAAFTASVVFDVVPELPERPAFPPPPPNSPPSEYALRLVPKVVNARASTGPDLLAMIRLAASIDPASAQGLRALLDGINDALADSASVDLNELVATLGGDSLFAPNAALVLTANQVRLRVQLARK